MRRDSIDIDYKIQELSNGKTHTQTDPLFFPHNEKTQNQKIYKNRYILIQKLNPT